MTSISSNSGSTNIFNAWEVISHTGLSVNAGETFTLFFQSIGSGSYGAHIEQMSLKYSPVPEPATIVLLGFGLVGLAGVSRKMSFR